MERNYVTVALCIIKFIKCKPPIIDFTKFEVHSCGVRGRVERRGGTSQLWCTGQGRTTWWNPVSKTADEADDDDDDDRDADRQHVEPEILPRLTGGKNPPGPGFNASSRERDRGRILGRKTLRSRLIFWSSGDGLGSRFRRQCGA